MKKLLLPIFFVFSNLCFTSCESELEELRENINEDLTNILENYESNLQTTTYEYGETGSISVSFPQQDSLIAGSTGNLVFKITVNGFNEYSSRRLNADFRTNSDQEFLMLFSKITVREVNGKTQTKEIYGDELEDDDLDIFYNFQDEGVYFFDGSEHIFEVSVDLLNFSESDQVFLNQIEMELEQELGDTHFHAELDTENNDRIYFLVGN